MAKILFTAIVADMRNKLNGTVFSKNRYGAYARTKVTPVNPQTPAQSVARAAFGTNAQAWRGLDEAQRQSWIDAAPSFPIFDIFGNQKILSGQALYNSLNGNLASIGAPLIATAPTPAAIPAVDGLGLVAAVTGSTLTLASATAHVPTGFRASLKFTPLYGPGIYFVKNKFRKTDSLTAGDDLNTNDVYPGWNAIFGNLVAGQKVSVSLTLVNEATGQAGVPLTASTIVAI